MIDRARPASDRLDAASVVIIDALPLVRYGLRALCAATPDLHCVASVPATDAGLAAVVRHNPRLVLLDSALDPKADLIAEISKTQAGPAVVVLLRREHQEPQYLRATRRAGRAHTTIVPRETDPSGLLAVLRRALPRRGSGPRPAELAGADPADTATLSARQLEVLVHVAHGHDNYTIARDLHLSPETVRTHVKAILARLGARNRTHAVTLAYHLGMLTTNTRGLPTSGDTASPG